MQPSSRADTGWSRERWFFMALAALSLCVLIAGFRLFLFVCDDAFIAFRYVSNSLLGHGYVWNAPPFRPVEGYSSFLWVLLLDATWRLTGSPPPSAVIAWSFVCALGQLAVVLAFARRFAAHTAFREHRLLLSALLVLGTVTNRTFLVWTSSGLEAPLFALLALSFVYVALYRPLGLGTLLSLGALAALLALCRPDGVLFVMTALALGALSVRAGRLSFGTALGALSPLLVVVAHVAWRRWFYGFFWPNTYYAKHLGAWPSAGGVYMVSFSVEYALYAWWLLVVLGALRAARSGLLVRLVDGVVHADEAVVRPLLVVASVLAHAAYYTFVIGGDHFEYRIYAPWIVLVLLSFLRLAEWVGWSARATSRALIGTLLLGLAIPWYHYAVTRRVAERGHSYVALAPTVSLEPVHTYLSVFDGLQGWLAGRMIGSRHHAHRIFSESYQTSVFPPRERGERVRGTHPVMVQSAVGVPGWVLPHVHILDRLGLNDAVVARTPHSGGPNARKMGHDRKAPDDYVACFSPNVRVLPGARISIDARERALSDADIIACESVWWRKRGLR